MIIRMAVEDDAWVLADHNVMMARESENVDIDVKTTLLGIKSVLADMSKGFYLVAEEEGEIIGQLMITFEWSDWRDKNIWWIQSVYIVKDWRKKYVFQQMLDEVYQLGRLQEVDIFRLYVYADNFGAIAAYKRLKMKQMKYLVFEKNFY